MATLAHTFKSVSYSYSHIINFTAPFGVLLAQDQRYKVLLLGFNLLLHDVLYQEYFGKALIIIVLIPSKSLLQLRLNPFAVILHELTFLSLKSMMYFLCTTWMQQIDGIALSIVFNYKA